MVASFGYISSFFFALTSRVDGASHKDNDRDDGESGSGAPRIPPE
jgi:hypothetical protein